MDRKERFPEFQQQNISYKTRLYVCRKLKKKKNNNIFNEII